MVVCIVEGLALEHGAGNAEEAVGDRAQGSAVGVAAGPQREVSFTARGIVLDGDAGPMVDGTAQTHVAGFTHDDDAALAASAGHGPAILILALGLIGTGCGRVEGLAVR